MDDRELRADDRKRGVDDREHGADDRECRADDMERRDGRWEVGVEQGGMRQMGGGGRRARAEGRADTIIVNGPEEL